MKKVLFTVLCLAMASMSYSQETGARKASRTGEAVGYSTRDVTTLSMMGWGLGLAIGIATLCTLIDDNATAHKSSSSSSSSH